jgi:cyclophilin family peptidyl-prolyl cis-trans isomerase
VKRMLILALTVAAFAAASARAENTVVVMETSMGTIKIELFDEKAPITVKNFLAYVDDKHYEDTIFHRVMSKDNSERDFMVQGGGYTSGMKEKKTKDPIKNEASNGLSNVKGTLAMARTNDPDSATSQFFINITDNKFLDKSPRGAGYAVFGKVIEGMDVVDKIKAVKTSGDRGRPVANKPVEDITIKSVKREKK